MWGGGVRNPDPVNPVLAGLVVSVIPGFALLQINANSDLAGFALPANPSKSGFA